MKRFTPGKGFLWRWRIKVHFLTKEEETRLIKPLCGSGSSAGGGTVWNRNWSFHCPQPLPAAWSPGMPSLVPRGSSPSKTAGERLKWNSSSLYRQQMGDGVAAVAGGCLNRTLTECKNVAPYWVIGYVENHYLGGKDLLWNGIGNM